jgi:phosphate transport system substrate-binding protein
MSGRHRSAWVAGMAVAAVLALLSGASVAGAATAGPPVAEINGSGSSWAAIAIEQWIANIYSQGVDVVFNPSGSAQGRQDFANGTTDYGVSDIGYQGFDPVTGLDDVSHRPYAYLPITGGGTSFPYNIVVDGQRVINLRLSGQTLADIFTNRITNWDDPAITRDNNGHALPSLPIITVVPSEGSGTTAMFTQYLNYEFPSLWKAFNNNQGGFTEYWPRQGPNQVAQDGSVQVVNYVQSPAANGSIGLAEYAYALQYKLPAAQIENAAGYYVLPTEFNDAVALTQAQINTDPSSPDYLLQNLDNVYNYGDPRAYPLSSYSYTIIPTSSSDEVMATSGSPPFPAKAQALAEFLDFSICQGQETIGNIGYSALPVNLVEAGFGQIEKIAAAAPGVQLSQLNILTCDNPTFVLGNPDANHLAQIAPYPPACDKAGQGPCVGTLNGNANGGQGVTANGGIPNTAAPSAATSGQAKAAQSGQAASKSKRGAVNSLTGASAPGATGGTATAINSFLPAGLTSPANEAIAALAVAFLVAVLVAPPVLARRRARREWLQL